MKFIKNVPIIEAKSYKLRFLASYNEIHRFKCPVLMREIEKYAFAISILR